MTEHHQQSALVSLDSMPSAIVIRGLPGSGKTTLANAVVKMLKDLGVQTFQINADVIRKRLNSDLGFTTENRIENARRIGALANIAQINGLLPVVDFVMPTEATYESFVSGIGQSARYVVMNIERQDPEFVSRFEDTNSLFESALCWTDQSHMMHLMPYTKEQIESCASSVILINREWAHLTSPACPTETD